MSAGGAFGGNRGVRPVPPEKGVFPLDHMHLCDLEKKEYLNCLKSAGHKSEGCRHLSKKYLECRMEKEPSVGGDCNRLYTALTGCHRQFEAGREREIACRHINRLLAECMVAVICPAESDAVRNLCSSGGTALKRQQCREAQLSLSVCLASHQDPS